MNFSTKLLPITPINPVSDFATFFNLKHDNESKIFFTGIVNCFGKSGPQKLDAKICISSDKLPMDTICIDAEQAESAGVPAMLHSGQDIISYLPGQFLMIKGCKQEYGHYNILLYPKMMEVVME